MLPLLSRAYMQFLATRRPSYASLKVNFRLNEFFTKLARMEQSRSSYQQKLSFLSEVINPETHD